MQTNSNILIAAAAIITAGVIGAFFIAPSITTRRIRASNIYPLSGISLVTDLKEEASRLKDETAKLLGELETVQQSILDYEEELGVVKEEMEEYNSPGINNKVASDYTQLKEVALVPFVAQLEEFKNSLPRNYSAQIASLSSNVPHLYHLVVLEDLRTYLENFLETYRSALKDADEAFLKEDSRYLLLSASTFIQELFQLRDSCADELTKYLERLNEALLRESGPVEEIKDRRAQLGLFIEKWLNIPQQQIDDWMELKRREVLNIVPTRSNFLELE